jgi:hypothetical protein
MYFSGTKCLSGSERRKGLPGGIQGNSVSAFFGQSLFIHRISFEATFTSFFKDKKS